MEDEYMILESRLNNTSLKQLEQEEPLTIPMIIKKLTDIANNPNTANLRAVHIMGGILSGNIKENVSTVFKLPRGIVYDPNRRSYLGRRDVDKKTLHVKQSVNVIEVIEAMEKFCLENDLVFD